MSAGGVRQQPNTGLRVQMEGSRARQTTKTDFGSALKNGLRKGADAVMTAGNLAAPFIPGGAVISAAVSGLGQVGSAMTSGGGGVASAPNAAGLQLTGGGGAIGSTNSMGGGGGSAMDAVGGMAAGGDSNAQMMMATREMQEMNMSFNLQYLGLQQKMQSDNRQFTLLSNIMKTKHDTAKAAINNVR